ncbi:hypothetical protein RchiOBHm_Chr4g0415521 [Rosa chinensis]|uniref:Uncharacterized protein n=1 Tax=Rosa chinensis TaxID=74649 RepID=A0A2P6QWK4_ROSCH|nr:hypothetical protein RchiOBHm_Chr4g0415521 [Rosa chinensis]
MYHTFIVGIRRISQRPKGSHRPSYYFFHLLLSFSLFLSSQLLCFNFRCAQTQVNTSLVRHSCRVESKMDLKTEINLEMELKMEWQQYSCPKRISEPAIEISAHKLGTTGKTHRVDAVIEVSFLTQ